MHHATTAAAEARARLNKAVSSAKQHLLSGCWHLHSRFILCQSRFVLVIFYEILWCPVISNHIFLSNSAHIRKRRQHNLVFPPKISIVPSSLPVTPGARGENLEIVRVNISGDPLHSNWIQPSSPYLLGAFHAGCSWFEMICTAKVNLCEMLILCVIMVKMKGLPAQWCLQWCRLKKLGKTTKKQFSTNISA